MNSNHISKQEYVDGMMVCVCSDCHIAVRSTLSGVWWMIEWWWPGLLSRVSNTAGLLALWLAAILVYCTCFSMCWNTCIPADEDLHLLCKQSGHVSVCLQSTWQRSDEHLNYTLRCVCDLTNPINQTHNICSFIGKITGSSPWPSVWMGGLLKSNLHG